MLENANPQEVDFLNQGGPTLELIRSVDWSNTSIGPREKWPQSLRSALSICINSNFPIAIYWGPELVLLYNEAWSPIPGNKHPWAFGKPAIEVWPDIWDAIEPQFAKAFDGKPGGSKDALLPMQRHGYTEECYFDFTFTPIYGESGKVEGIFNAVIETTYRVINERRGAVLQRLTEAINGISTEKDIFKISREVLDKAKEDIPFFLIYEVRNKEKHLKAQSNAIDALSDTVWPASDVLYNGTTLVISNLDAYVSTVPIQHWPEPPTEAVIVPLRSGEGSVSGFLVGGASARRKIDKDYKSFFESVANIISGELNTLDSLMKERERAEALAEIDKAKTAFFSNISHEFRTPLTLMISPLEEVLNTADNLSAIHKDHLQTSLRNTFRLQKLVNTLLDFSKIEAGKLDVNLQITNVSQVTRDLASSFRSAIESAGISYDVQVPDLNSLVAIDLEMWDKIVLNLISNAFKYTERGKISVELSADDRAVKLTVADTGIGIEKQHVSKIFERFYRINNHGGRSQEGTGIGLAMVKELVSLNHGEIGVDSKFGKGTVFTVSIPVAEKQLKPPLPQTHDIKNSKLERAFTEEASKWKLNADKINQGRLSSASGKSKVLIADDNSDMLEYISRVLSNDFQVHAVTNGEDAFLAAQEFNPDLIISDIMMPRLDGFGLLKKLKTTLVTRNIPVIFLSARAGEESRVEGIEAGADDYLVKPFSAKELVARVGNQIAINKTRSDTEKEFFRLFLQLPAHIHVFKGPEHFVEFFHPMGKKVIGRDITGMKIRDALPELEGQGFFELLDKVFQTGEKVSLPASRAYIPDDHGKPVEYYFSITYLPWRDTHGNLQGVLQFTIDVTEQTRANLQIRQSEEQFRILANSIPQFVWIADVKGEVEFMSEQWEKYTGTTSDEGRRLFSTFIHEHDVADVRNRWKQSLHDGTAWTSEFRLRNVKTGEYRWFLGHTLPLKDDHGHIIKWMGSASDIHAQKTIHFELEGLVAERTSELVKLNHVLIQKNDDLARAQSFLQTVLDASVELVTAFDKNLNFTFINKRIKTFSRLNAEELVGKNLLDVDPGVEKTEGYQYLLRALKGETVHIKVRKASADSPLIFETFVMPLTLHGQVTGVMTMQRDITEIINLTESLKASNEQLTRSNEDLQQFAHVTSHDLKEPVRKIKMYGNILGTEYSQYLPEKGKEYLARIERASGRISAMIDGVLQYSTIDVTDQSMIEIDLNTTVQSIIEDLEIPIKEHGATIVFDKLPVIKGYPTLIYQLFYNLINNSLKFRRKDVKPSIKFSFALLSEAEKNESGGDYFKLTIRDNGVGFDQSYSEKIFESFTRLHPKDQYEGTGLGLALCRKIVLRHEGIIKATGDLNKGATFVVFFPEAILS